MRRIIAALLVLGAFALPAAAQQTRPRARMAIIPPSVRTTVPPGGAGDKPGSGQTLIPPAPAAPDDASATGVDSAPQCRAQCAEQRYVCLSASDGPCDQRWTQCLATCRAAPAG